MLLQNKTQKLFLILWYISKAHQGILKYRLNAAKCVTIIADNNK